jgi:hypothetical protein
VPGKYWFLEKNSGFFVKSQTAAYASSSQWPQRRESPSSGLKDQRLLPRLMSLVGSYWPRGRYDFQARAHERLLLPLPHLGEAHRGRAFEVDGEAEDRVEEAGAVGVDLGFLHGSLEVADAVGQRRRDVGRAAEEGERAIERERRHVQPSGRPLDRDRALEAQIAVVPDVAERDRVAADRGDDVDARREVLGLERRKRGERDGERRRGAPERRRQADSPQRVNVSGRRRSP